jgi:predicted tellurium resistance membrane protein TerC
MLIAAEPLARFIAKNPTIVMLALGFLLMIGMTLIADGFGFHVPKGYIYAAMGFSALVEGSTCWRAGRAGNRGSSQNVVRLGLGPSLTLGLRPPRARRDNRARAAP